MSDKDFFFGDIFHEYNSTAVALSAANKMAAKVSSDYFTVQLNRLLRNNGGKISIISSVSHPDFDTFLQRIKNEAIGFIEIYPRTDINENVDATLACDLFLTEGVISVIAQWCGRTENREEEIVDTLLIPIHSAALEKKTYLRFDEEKTEALLIEDRESTPLHVYANEIKRVIRLSKTDPSIDISTKAKDLELTTSNRRSHGYDDTPANKLTKREYLASRAPENPQPWFKPQLPPMPIVPKPEDNLSEEQLNEWCLGNFEIAEIASFREVYEKAYIAHKDWERIKASAKYAQWPWAWADAVLNAEATNLAKELNA